MYRTFYPAPRTANAVGNPHEVSIRVPSGSGDGARSRDGSGRVTGRLLTTRELAELLGLSAESVLRYRAGEIPGFRLSSNVLRFDPSEIESWLAGCRRRGPCNQPVEVLQSEST